MKYSLILLQRGGSELSSIREIKSSTSMPIDLAEKIGINGINEILDVFWVAYHALLESPRCNISVNTNEDYITQEWFLFVQRIWFSQNRATLAFLSPVHQYGDTTMQQKGKSSPSIDFCFRDWNSINNSYFGAEAKNLYRKNKSKIVRYVNTGISHYTSGRYGSQSSKSAMLGYVLSGEIPNIVMQLTDAIAMTSPIENLSRMTYLTDPQYLSKHLRSSDNKEIEIFHLFFDFSHK